jgi:hypothetical protein
MPRLSGKHICFLVAHEFEDVELLYPLLRLSEEGRRSRSQRCPRPGTFTRARIYPKNQSRVASARPYRSWF